MREEFEAWVKAGWPNQSLDRFNPLNGVTEDEYMGFTVQHCWDAWQASREALVVTLPPAEEFDGYYNGGFAIRKENVVAAIEAAGVKVKP